ncbi:MAG: hypothetical protein Q8Q94_00310 [bacterium]|nr:hypothetical protein [bacterium]
MKRRNRTIEKEKAWTVLKRIKNVALFIAIADSLLLLYVHLYLYPTLNELYKTFNYPHPILLRVAPYATLVMIPAIVFLALYIYLSESIDNEFKENLKHYKDGAKIRIGDLTGKKLKLLLNLLYLLPSVVIGIFTLLPPFWVIFAVSSWAK